MAKRIPLIAAISVVGSMALASQPKSINQALAIAQQHLASTASRVASFTLSAERCYPSSAILTDARLTPGQEAFYVFYGQSPLTYDQSRQPGEGFVIVAADDRPSPILGYSPQGHFDPSDLPDNLRRWLEGYLYEPVSEVVDNQPLATTAVGGHVEPLCTTRWGQEKPYNTLLNFFSSGKLVTGCVATAMAQAMSVYRYPAQPVGMIDYYTRTDNAQVTIDLGNYLLDWDYMRDEYIDGEYTEREQFAVSELMLVCGGAAQMDYGYGSSGASMSDALVGMIEYLGYDEDMLLLERSCLTDEEWNQLLTSELESGHPMIYSGAANGEDAHAFLLDGYEVEDGELYYHFNWGWDGIGDGFYRLNAMQPEGSEYDYKLHHKIIANVKPDNDVPEYESLFTAESITVDRHTVDIGKGEKTTLTLKKVYNSINKEFSGEFRFYLIDDKGEHFAGHAFIKNVQFEYGWSRYKFVLAPEYRVPAGEYLLEVRTRLTNSDVEQHIYCGNGREKITVVDSSDSEMGIESVVANQPSISLSDGICTVSGLPEGAQVAVYDLAGRLVGSALSSRGVAEINVRGHNRIIVHTLVDGQALNQKVVVSK